MEQAGMYGAGFESSPEARPKTVDKAEDPRREANLCLFGTVQNEAPQYRDDAATESHLSRLAKTIENQIVPRLMLAHRAGESLQEREAHAGVAIEESDVTAFAGLIVGNDEETPLTSIERLRARGTSVESIYLDLLAPTARYLGELWERDLCDFLDVTIGLGRLHRVLRELSTSLPPHASGRASGCRILLLPCPGEQHTFGLAMVADFFRRAGWQVSDGPWGTSAEVASLVASEWFDVAGFSLGAAAHIEELAQCITQVRESTRNMNLGIMVGGPIFAQYPAYVSLVGADATAMDGKQALSQAEQLIVAKMHQR